MTYCSNKSNYCIINSLFGLNAFGELGYIIIVNKTNKRYVVFLMCYITLINNIVQITMEINFCFLFAISLVLELPDYLSLQGHTKLRLTPLNYKFVTLLMQLNPIMSLHPTPLDKTVWATAGSVIVR